MYRGALGMYSWIGRRLTGLGVVVLLLFHIADTALLPAALVHAHRFIFDSRDRGAVERLDILNAREGVWRCRTIFNCVEACPREINITRAIGQIKTALLYNRFQVAPVLE